MSTRGAACSLRFPSGEDVPKQKLKVEEHVFYTNCPISARFALFGALSRSTLRRSSSSSAEAFCDGWYGCLPIDDALTGA